MKRTLLSFVLILTFVVPAIAGPISRKAVDNSTVLLAEFVITPTVTEPTEKMRYLYRARRMLINKLNALIGQPGYQVFHDSEFMPMIKEIHAEMAKLTETSSVGVAPAVNPDAPENQAIMNAYIAEKASLSASKTYDADIGKDNEILKP